MSDPQSDDTQTTSQTTSETTTETGSETVTDTAAEQILEEPGAPTLWEQMGGPAGMLDSGLPVVVFVIGNSIGGLTAGIVAALTAGVLIFLVRLTRRRPVTQAIGGLFGVGLAAFIAHRSGSAGGYFLVGIYSYLLYGTLLVLSMVFRIPAIGLIWEGVNGRGMAWRKDRALVRRYDYATAVWVGVFAARYLVQRALLGSDEIGWLGFARIVMGYPLYLLAIATSVWIVMRGTGWERPSLRSLMARKRT